MTVQAKPILMSTPMVQASMRDIDPKTQTRRVMNPQPPKDMILNTKYLDGTIEFKRITQSDPLHDYAEYFKAKPRYHTGDILWVRETWCHLWALDDNGKAIDGTESYYYLADGLNPTPFNCFPDEDGFHGDRDYPRWKPSIHMPREAARLFQRVTGVRAERLQDITPQDCRAEGIINDVCTACLNIHSRCSPQIDVDRFCGNNEQIVEQYADLWDSLNAKRDGGIYAWDINPWVWVYEFKKIDKEDVSNANR